jgi:hypothetical protein
MPVKASVEVEGGEAVPPRKVCGAREADHLLGKHLGVVGG